MALAGFDQAWKPECCRPRSRLFEGVGSECPWSRDSVFFSQAVGELFVNVATGDLPVGTRDPEVLFQGRLIAGDSGQGFVRRWKDDGLGEPVSAAQEEINERLL